MRLWPASSSRPGDSRVAVDREEAVACDSASPRFVRLNAWACVLCCSVRWYCPMRRPQLALYLTAATVGTDLNRMIGAIAALLPTRGRYQPWSHTPRRRRPPSGHHRAKHRGCPGSRTTSSRDRSTDAEKHLELNRIFLRPLWVNSGSCRSCRYGPLKPRLRTRCIGSNKGCL